MYLECFQMIACSTLSKLNKQKRRLLAHFYHFCYSQKQRDLNIKLLTLFAFSFIFHFNSLRYYRNLGKIYLLMSTENVFIHRNWMIWLNIIVIDLVNLHNTKKKYITKCYIKRKIPKLQPGIFIFKHLLCWHWQLKRITAFKKL